MRPGFVYILSNPGLSAYKVGMTTRALHLRPAELKREYGTLYPFKIASRHAVDNPAAVEALAHRFLGRYRVRRSELFTCDLETCQRAVMRAARVVLGECPRWLRVWYWLTLPQGSRTRSGWQKSRAGSRAGFFGVLALVGLAVALALLKPDLPPWVPSSMLRAAYLVERLH